ncbi:MAG TPA: hypothetical protein VGQ04_10720 [Chitinophagaceae bacterium]|jgi:hypothetical protein|nr:hypothetical protein [Chitinophagaceae bacterium]
MEGFLIGILDWSEVWALLIPLAVLLFQRPQSATLKPIIIYLWIAFILNLGIDIIMVLRDHNLSWVQTHFPEWLKTNNPLYNIHSVARFTCFSIYFIQLQHTSFVKFRKLLAVSSVIFIIINFSIFENFFNPRSFSGNLLATEAYLLLVYCMLYYLSELKDDSKNLFNGPDFWVVTGLSIYVVINFFVFLFYLPMIDVDQDLAINIWNVHNIAFIIFCLFITKGLYGSHRYKYSV